MVTLYIYGYNDVNIKSYLTRQFHSSLSTGLNLGIVSISIISIRDKNDLLFFNFEIPVPEFDVCSVC
jgi:hypothetical protein